MRIRSLFVIVVVTLFVAGAAFYAVKNRDEGNQDVASAGILYPELKSKLNDIDSIDVTSSEVSVKVVKKDNQWVVPEKFEYSADFKNIKRNLSSFAEMIKVEPKTKRAEHYKDLGVGPIEKDSRGTRFVLRQSSNVLADLYIGNHAPGLQDGYFVRMEGDDQVWLARGNQKITADLKDWLQVEIVSIDKNRIASVDFKPHGSPEFKVWRDDAKKTSFQMKPVPENRTIKSPYIIDMVSKGLSELSFVDVLPKDRVEFNPAPCSIFKTFDGLVVEVFLGKGHKQSGDEAVDSKSSKDFLNKTPGGNAESNEWLNFRFSFDPELHQKHLEKSEGTKDNAEEEAKKLNEKLAPWAYHIASYKLEILKRDLESMLAPIVSEGGNKPVNKS